MKTWFRFVSSHIEQTASLGVLRLIAPLLTGVDRNELINTTDNIFDQLLNIIVKSDFTDNFQVNRKEKEKQNVKFVIAPILISFSYRFKVNCYGFVEFLLRNVKKN